MKEQKKAKEEEAPLHEREGEHLRDEDVHEQDGGHLRDEDDCQLLREVHRHCRQAKSCPHFVPAAAPNHILFSAKASLEEILSEEQ